MKAKPPPTAFVVLAGAACLAVVAACSDERLAEVAALTGGDPERGSLLAREYGCGACHEIPGVLGAVGRVGPPLRSLAMRVYVAGRLPNTPANLVQWIAFPDRVSPGSAMPNLGVSETNARHIAAFLYSVE